MTEIDPQLSSNAVSIYGKEPGDDFPVLKAFQQYIDAEQAKARKRMMLLCVFFSFLLVIVIGVFVALLISSTARIQLLNDRLIEFAMKDRDRNPPVVVQPQQDNSAILTLVGKLDEMRKSMEAENAARAADAKSAAKEAPPPTPQPAAASPAPSAAQMLEIERLKAQLAAEKEKAAVEREKLRQMELEAYRRKHYPDLYQPQPTVQKPAKTAQRARQRIRQAEEEADAEIEAILNDTEYLLEDEDEEIVRPKSKRTKSKSSAVPKQSRAKPAAAKPVSDKNSEAAAQSDDFVIPVDVKDSAGNSWTIPLE